MTDIHIETDQEYKDRIFDGLLKDSGALTRIKAVINRDTKQHWLDLGDKAEDINKLTVKQFEELERNQKLNDIKLILRHAEMENK